MGEPVAALFSASRTSRGKLIRPAPGRFGAGRTVVELEGLFGKGSYELQLEAPKAATKPSTIIVATNLSGVQNFTSFSIFFLSDILSYFFLPNLNESSMIGASPFTPTSSTEDNSPARDVPHIVKVAPVVSPSVPVGRNTTRPHSLTSPRSVPFERPSHLN